jgi:hypothetical protein
MEPGAKRRTGKEKETLAAVPLFPARLFTMAGEYAGDDGDGMGLAGFDEGVVEGDQRWVPLAAGGLGSGEQARSGALAAEASQPADAASWSRRPRQEPVLR